MLKPLHYLRLLGCVCVCGEMRKSFGRFQWAAPRPSLQDLCKVSLHLRVGLMSVCRSCKPYVWKYMLTFWDLVLNQKQTLEMGSAG